ncbi:ATP-dependent endonuclease [Microbacterium sp. RURRCA19A]|uniref:ATP-dependent nuclease n=1 Tax=Microbacterium sp. RURRCA19A TaxID=1907391 RepID=UPI000970A26A|nr:AAA family ATPase [Microbacterium sp. RURRCA19A]
MKISHVAIRNYRSLKEVDIVVDDYSVLVGANGAGKSSVLYALDWFFNGRALSPSDVHGYVEGTTEDDNCFVEVTVTFRDLTIHDKARLQQYGRGTTATFRRTWRRGSGEKVVGNALQGPGFADLRAMTRVTELRPAYRALREEVTGLPELSPSPSKDDVLAALSTWEDDSSHQSQLVAVEDSDANHMFGINGSNVIKECVRLVLIPAATDISSQVGDSGGRGSALNGLIGAVMAEAGARATAEWLAENEDAIVALQRRVRDSVQSSTHVQAERVNSRLSNLIPNAQLTLTPSLPDWTPKANASVTTDITIDGVTNDIARQGHGVQRAVMMSMFEALVPDDVLMRSIHEPRDGENEEETEARLQDELDRLPNLIVCIEEPEIYQHPIRARTFARTLTELSGQSNAQVILATHSPYFVRPDQFSSLRRFTLSGGKTTVAHTNAEALEAATGIDAAKISKIVDKRVPTEFSEGFFADSVVLVEGDTDRAVIEAVASRMGLDLDARGVSVIEVSSKESLRIPCEIFSALGVPTYIVADADFLGAQRKYPDDEILREDAHQNHLRSTNLVLSWVRGADGVVGSSTFAFGDASSSSPYVTFWHDDLETELSSWASFNTALVAEGNALRVKNLYAYRSAVMDADLADLPDALRTAIEVMAAFGHPPQVE